MGWPSKWKFISSSTILGFFTAFVDGRFTSGTVPNMFYGGNWTELLVIAIPTLIGGAIAGLLVTRRFSKAARIYRIIER